LLSGLGAISLISVFEVALTSPKGFAGFTLMEALISTSLTSRTGAGGFDYFGAAFFIGFVKLIFYSSSSSP
jgi:type II secretory pathway component PulJ